MRAIGGIAEIVSRHRAIYGATKVSGVGAKPLILKMFVRCSCPLEIGFLGELDKVDVSCSHLLCEILEASFNECPSLWPASNQFWWVFA